MKVIATESGFYGGALRKPMEEFEFRGKKPGKWMVPVGERQVEEIKEEEKGMTRKEIMAQLSAAGVKFETDSNKATLQDLFDKTMKKLNPAGSDAPDKSLQNL